MAKEGLSVRLPLGYDKIDGPYQLNKELNAVIQQNLKMVIFCNIQKYGKFKKNSAYRKKHSNFRFGRLFFVCEVVNPAAEGPYVCIINSTKTTQVEEFWT